MVNRTASDDRAKPPRQWRWLLWLLVLVLILAALAGTAYLQRMTLLTYAADRILQPYGMQVAALDGVQLGTTALRIRHLAIQHSDSGKRQNFANITVRVKPETLLRGRVDTISIASATLDIPDTAAGNMDPPAATDGTPAPDTRMALTNLVAAIPVKRLRIDHLQIAAGSMTAGHFRASDLSIDLQTVQLTCQPDRCQIGAELNLAVDSLHFGEASQPVALERITYSTDTPVLISIEANTNTLTLTAPSSTLTLPAIRMDDTLTGVVTSIRRLHLSQPLSASAIDPAALYAQAEITVRQLSTNLVATNLQPMQLDQHLTWAQGTVHATGSLTHGNQRLLHNDLQHDVKPGAGRGTLTVPTIDFNDSAGKLSDLWSPMPWRADILAGTASAHARLDWRIGPNTAVITGPVQVNLNNLSGYVNDIAFLRLSADFAAELMPDWRLRSTRATQLSLDSLDAGIELADIRSNLRIDASAGSVLLTDTSLNVFGGTVSSERLDYHLQDNDSRFDIVIDRIDLNQVLSMSAYQAVSASGLVSGQLPVRLQGLTPSISDGTLSALPPGGTIRYDSGTAAGSQRLELVYQALQHYRFNLMEARVNYQESGELDLAIRMEGTSPELNGGQRINLNLNINDNIPALLQSLQAARSVSDSIQTRLDIHQQ